MKVRAETERPDESFQKNKQDARFFILSCYEGTELSFLQVFLN